MKGHHQLIISTLISHHVSSFSAIFCYLFFSHGLASFHSTCLHWPHCSGLSGYIWLSPTLAVAHVPDEQLSEDDDAFYSPSPLFSSSFLASLTADHTIFAMTMMLGGRGGEEREKIWREEGVFVEVTF